MPAFNNVSLGGVTLTPSKKVKKIAKVGALQEDANGGREWIQRVDGGSNPIVKRTWELTFDLVINAMRAQLEALFLANATATFRDENGESFTVQCEADEYSESFEKRSAAGDLYYTVQITIHQI